MPAQRPPRALEVTGNAAASISALDIGLVGTFSWDGFGSSTFASSGAIHFDSVTNDGTTHRTNGRSYNGQMTASGDLIFSAARLSPATYSDFRVDLTSDPNSSITIARPATTTASESLSPAGYLEFAAGSINQNGTVTAPLGEIVFNAPNGNVTLGADSVTSVAANTNLLFGYTTESGTQWQYAGTEVSSLPDKSITIKGLNTTVTTGAKLDLSGGGDAIAYEFTAGPGGKSDILAASANTYAIVPTWSGFSATDFQLQDGYLVSSDGATTALHAGDTITLAANPAGLTGSYVLLPARYALLPGAYLVTVKNSGTQLRNAQTQADGSWLINATISAANADGTTTAYSNTALTVELANSAVVANRAEYTITKGSEFFYDTDGGMLSGDAGRLVSLATGTLRFDPSVVAMRVAEIAAADGRTRAGRGLEMDLSAPKLLVSDGTAQGGAGWSVLDQNKLIAIGADSLLLGGTRTTEGSTTRIDTLASEVKVGNNGNADSRKALTGAEIMLAAIDAVTVMSGSRVDTKGSEASRDIVLTTGDGAFLRAAEGGQASLSRQGTITRTTGDLIVEADATVAGQSLVFDATHTSTLDGNVVLGVGKKDGTRRESGGAIAIGAGRINVVGDHNTNAPTDGLTLSNGDIEKFSQADEIRLTSYSTLDLYGNAELGTASLKELTLAAAGIAGHGDAGNTATITAQSVLLQNPNPESASYLAGTALCNGNLAINANSIEFGSNATEAMRKAETTGFAIRGFRNVGFNATGDVRLSGTGVTAIDNDAAFDGNGNAANLTVNANRVVTVGTADHLLAASGAATISRNANATGSSTGTGLGGSLEMRAKSMDISGTLSAAAGSLKLSGADYVKVLDGARIAAEGTKVVFDDTAAYAPGGSVVIGSNNGDVNVASGASLSVSAESGGGNGGNLSLIARNGSVSADAGTLHGTAKAGADGATLKVDAASIDLDILADAVSSGSFGGTWDARARSGDLTLSKTISSGNVSIAADNGSVAVGSTGTIDASGDQGGKIALYANNGNVTLQGKLLSRGNEVVTNTNNAGTRGQGGTVLLSASGTTAGGSAGKVLTQTGSLIDVGVADGSMASGGKVTLRAAASASIASAGDLNVQIAGTITGASKVATEMVKTYKGYSTLKTGTTSGTSLGLTSIQNALQAVYTADAVSKLRQMLFGSTDSALYHVTPGVEIDAASDFTIANDLDFSALRFQGEAGALTIRAQGNLKINNSISDGFVSAGTFTATSRDAKVSSSDASWSYRLVAGADSSAAAITATNEGAQAGNLEISASKLVRTGTGDIVLAAKGDITLKDKAVVYTAGRDDSQTLDSGIFTAVTANDSSATGARNHYVLGGGDLSISAGGSINQASTGALTDWLIAYSKDSMSTQWWARIASFQQGFAAFGGGNVALSAGKDLVNVTAVIPTNGRVPGANGEILAEQALINGGGNLQIKAGGTIQNGLFYAETGSLNLVAGKDIADNPVIALGNTAANIAATGSISLGNIYNPMGASKRSSKLKNSSGGPLTGVLATGPEYQRRIGTYGEDTSLTVTTVNGNADINAATDSLDGIAPAKVTVAALNGNIGVDLQQMPSASGQLDLLAKNDINVRSLVQYDVAAGNLPAIGNPLTSGADYDPFDADLAARLLHSASLWHINDSEASRLIALNGSITGNSSLGSELVFSEPVNIQAAKNIENLNLSIQHAKSADVSRIVAGGDIRYAYQTASNSSGQTKVAMNTLGIQVGGPGRVEVIAGGDIDLADTNGIVTRGNLDNPFLPETGASITAMAGTQVVDKAAANYANDDALRAYLQGDTLATYVKAAGINTADLASMSDETLREAFFQVLREIGRDAVASGDKAIYAKGRALIAALFPNTSGSANDIKLSVSQIKTERGGDIQLLTPTGSVIVGVAAPTLTKEASKQGIFTINGGDIYAMVEKNYLVNQSRTFTLDGGDIMMWSNHGDIDAGRGAKTQVATPPPVLVIRNGQIVVDTSNAVTGSGIGVLASQDDTPAADMDLFAPDGTIDAGDAGLRSTGNINLGAAVILNSSNIQAAGAVSGAPAAPAAAAPVATVTSPTESAGNTAEEATATAAKQEEALGVLTVEVLDGEAAPAPEKQESDDERKKKKS